MRPRVWRSMYRAPERVPSAPYELQEVGPTACPADSRIGFGSGTAKSELGGQILSGPFTLEFFLAPSEGGRRAFLIYVNE